MIVRSLLSASALLVITGAVAPAASRTLEQERVGSWALSAVADDQTGAFAGCDAKSETQADASRLMVSLDRSKTWSVGFIGKLGAQPGQANTTRYRIDRGPTFSGVATAVSDTLVRLPLEDGNGALRALRSGRQLMVDGGNDRLVFALRDMPAVLASLQRCAERWETRDVPPVGPGPGGPPQAREAGRPLTEVERRLEATTVAVNILSRAQLTGFELQPPDVPARLAAHDVTWRAQNLSGSLRLVGQAGEAVVEKVRAELISADILACPGRFRAESATGAEGKSSSLFTLCQDDKGWSLNYLVIPRPLGGAYVLSLVGPSEKADPLKAMAESLRNVALQVIARPAPSAAVAETPPVARP